MKKLIAVSFCLSVCFIINAQVRVGVKGGLNLNQPFSGKKAGAKPDGFVDTGFPFAGVPSYDIDRFELHANFHAGFTVDIPITKKFHIRPDLLYSRRVADYKEKGTRNGYEYFFNERFVADYLELPVNFVYYHQMRSAAFYVGGGPYFALPLSGSVDLHGMEWRNEGGFPVPASMFTSHEANWYSKFQFGAVVSAGIDLPFGLNGELSVHSGFNDINRSKYMASGNKVINFNYAVSVGYLLGKKKK
ncbi:MAG: porin family protein [Pseudobacter sp.]|uniref:porin family protein n=1 Tax=Pseudobacter sp. TaxID=2045420 RepID=UPI003F7D8586